MARTYKQLSLEEGSLLQTQLVMGWRPAATWLGPDRRAQRPHALPRLARKLVPGNPLLQLVIQHLRRRLCNVIVPTWMCNARPAEVAACSPGNTSRENTVP